VMIEAMACGTPVIALRRGSVPEIVEHGRTGFVVGDLDEAVAAAERIGTLSRQRCREVFEERFTAARMARDYVALYESLLETGERRAVGAERR
jgi:glycosyltransferase involved in cell wall biosynthesis